MLPISSAGGGIPPAFAESCGRRERNAAGTTRSARRRPSRLSGVLASLGPSRAASARRPFWCDRGITDVSTSGNPLSGDRLYHDAEASARSAIRNPNGADVKALVLKEYGRLSYEEVPMPAVGPDDVLVQVKACGICGSDVHGLDGSTGRRVPPLIMGHEAAGAIARAGERVTAWHPGDRVTFDSTLSCGACRFCRRGEINLCDRRRVLGVSCEEYRQDGAFAEYVAVPQHILYRLPEGLDWASATLVEPLSVALHALSLTPVALNDTAIVVGVG